MRFDDRVHGIADLGFTPRQARFLVTVMLHSGVSLPRQYAAFAGIVHGQRTRMFFANLVNRRYASSYRCRHNRGRIYQVHHKALYRAIGQTDSRHRRPLSPARVVRGLTLLDAVLSDSAVAWLATDQDKILGLADRISIDPELLHLAIGTRADTRRFVATKFPVGIDPNGRVVLLYVAPDSEVDVFRAFIQRHLELLRRVPAWTLRVVVPPWPEGLAELYAKTINEELTATLRPALITELRHYFAERRKVVEAGWEPPDPEHFDQAAHAFQAPRALRPRGSLTWQSASSVRTRQPTTSRSVRMTFFISGGRRIYLLPEYWRTAEVELLEQAASRAVGPSLQPPSMPIAKSTSPRSRKKR